MMSLDTIIRMNDEAVEKARKLGLGPYCPESVDEVDEWPMFPFPMLGGCPEGWHEVESLFVDKTGTGYDHEPALTTEQFKRELRRCIRWYPHVGFYLHSEGQFQIYCSACVPSHTVN